MEVPIKDFIIEFPLFPEQTIFDHIDDLTMDLDPEDDASSSSSNESCGVFKNSNELSPSFQDDTNKDNTTATTTSTPGMTTSKAKSRATRRNQRRAKVKKCISYMGSSLRTPFLLHIVPLPVSSIHASTR